MGDFDLNTILQLNEIEQRKGGEKSPSLPLLQKEVKVVESLVFDG